MKQVHKHTVSLLTQEIGQRLFERLDFIKIKTNTLVQLSPHAESIAHALQIKYPTAAIKHVEFLKDLNMPFETHSIDFIFSNCLPQWSTHLPLLLSEIKRILKPEGCLLFSTFGPDTSLSTINDYFKLSISHFLDMHDIGDALVEYQFLDPVMDAEHIQIEDINFEIIYGLAWNAHESTLDPLNSTHHKIPIKML